MKKTVRLERKAQATLLCHLAEVERRKLFAILGYSSMFNYVTQNLSYSEASALKRIQVARAAMRYPQIYNLIEQGKTSLTALMKICPHLRDHNFLSLLKATENKSVKQVEEYLSGKYPKPEPSDIIKPLSEDRVWFLFCGDRELSDMVEQTRALLSHQFPNGKLGDIFKVALRLLITQQKKKWQASKSQLLLSPMPPNSSPSSQSRHIPQYIKAAVWKRDGGRCSYTSPQGKCCEESHFLEFDHKLPWALGGSSDDVGNIRLLCRTHNRLMADEVFGTEYIKNKIREKVSGNEEQLYMNRFHLESWFVGGVKNWRDLQRE